MTLPDNISYYLAILALVIIGVVVAKKIASCLVKTVIVVILTAVGLFIYYQYLR